jgi:class 3 adenylate cyclase
MLRKTRPETGEMNLKDEVKQLRESLEKSENIQAELDRRIFHLKTLYDVSKDIFATVDFEIITKSFLLMTMGNFGMVQGFILALDRPSGETTHFVSMGFHGSDPDVLRDDARRFLLAGNIEAPTEKAVIVESAGFLPENVACALSFAVGPACSGLLGLGSKLTGDSYSEDDRELLCTLVNNLVVALRNARSFEDVKRLNKDLQGKNVELEQTLKELQAAMRKIEILESIKTNLCKFVPTTVTRLIEKSPTAPLPECREQDVSVLFVDIQGYTKISERLGGAELNKVVEQYFSVFMDAIYANNGDVNETAGDGLMVLFSNEDERTNALEAARAALWIRDKATVINQQPSFSESLVINMGINSGRALLGTAKFESMIGCRCTYTARGMVTNIAARIGALATDGAILLSKETADRLKDNFSLNPKGTFNLKNVSEEVEVFTL